MATFGEQTFDLTGFLFVMFALFAGALRWVLTQKFVDHTTGEESENNEDNSNSILRSGQSQSRCSCNESNFTRVNSVDCVFWIAPSSAATLAPIFFIVELGPMMDSSLFSSQVNPSATSSTIMITNPTTTPHEGNLLLRALPCPLELSSA